MKNVVINTTNKIKKDIEKMESAILKANKLLIAQFLAEFFVLLKSDPLIQLNQEVDIRNYYSNRQYYYKLHAPNIRPNILICKETIDGKLLSRELTFNVSGRSVKIITKFYNTGIQKSGFMNIKRKEYWKLIEDCTCHHDINFSKWENSEDLYVHFLEIKELHSRLDKKSRLMGQQNNVDKSVTMNSKFLPIGPYQNFL